jgi:hypothetical protein
MNPVTRRIATVLIIVTTTRSAAVMAADDSLAAARTLYASAAYEDALALLERLPKDASSDAFTVHQYRAFCLLALGRTSEAQSAIEAVIAADPLYRPSDGEVSPRVRTAFTEVRRRLLPSIVQQQYAQAKSAFERKEFADSAKGFTRVLKVLADPDLATAASQPPLSDLRTLAGGFQELSAQAAAPPPLATVAAAPPPPALPPQVMEPARPRLDLQVYDATNPKVVPPLVLRQELPPYNVRVPGVTSGSMEVVIDERGMVERATIKTSVNPMYDRLAVSAARNWRYQAASIDGTPVKYRKVIQITIKPPA